jgi:hypothetical protein
MFHKWSKMAIHQVFSDIFLLMVTFVFNVAFSFILYVVVFQLGNVKRIVTTFNKITVLATLITGVLSFVLLKPYYTSDSTFYIGSFGILLAAIFFLGLFSYAGPICADRSISVAMAILLTRAPQFTLTKQKLEELYSNDKILGKRYEEFREAGVVLIQNETLVLTKKGQKIAQFYMLLLKFLNLKENF